MSHHTFNTAWEESDRQLRDLATLEADPDARPPPTDRQSSVEFYSLLYIKYIQIFKRLSEAYDQMVHPQKRRVLRTLVEGTMGRVLELKHTLVDLECSDYHYFDELIADLKLTPEDIELDVPPYFRREISNQLREREKVLDAAGAETMDPREEPDEPDAEPMTREAAIRIIQVHERARQGRLRAKFMMDLRAENARKKRLGGRGSVSSMSPDAAALVLQKYYRGHLTRRRVRAMRDEGDVYVGMAMPPPLPKGKDPLVKAAATVAQRHATQEQYENQFTQDLVNIRKKVEQVEGPDMRENMADEIREMFTACLDATGSLPDFPSVEDGGSKAFFDPPAPADDEGGDEGEDGDGGGAAKKGGKKKGSGKKGKKGSGKKGKKGKGGGDDGEEEEPQGPPPSVFAPLIADSSASYRADWRGNVDDQLNVHQKHDRDVVKAVKRREVEDELRLQVDELMREELANLKAAVEGAKKGKGKKGGKKGKGKKGGKGGKKGKKTKDMTADRTPMSIFEELAREGLAKRVPELRVRELVGQYSHLGTAQRRDPKRQQPEPSMADVRRVAILYGVLPLGSQAVHEVAPVHVKSLLLVGPPGSGKRTLVAAMAHELGACLFDLTPSNTAGKYTAKKGVDGLDGMMHKVFKVAKLFQPSIVYIGDACSVHAKKKPKDDPHDSTRMKKELPKIVKKELSPGDRVVIVGTEDKPFDADMKAVSAVYQKIVRVPRPDYGTRVMLWSHFIREAGAGASHPRLDLSSLSKISDGYTAGAIQSCVRKALGPRRLATLASRPLAASEFVPTLAKLTPVYDEEDAAYADFIAKTPLGKKAEKLAAGDGEGGGKSSGKGKKKKSGKKKKK